MVKTHPIRCQQCSGTSIRLDNLRPTTADVPTWRWIVVHTRHLDALDAAAARELTAALTEAAAAMEHSANGTSAPTAPRSIVQGSKGDPLATQTEGGIVPHLPGHHHRSWMPARSDPWIGFPSLATLRSGHTIRLEDEMQDGHYLLRAELPGIDPAKDVDITVREGQLIIKAERSEKKESKGRSEFSYGSFIRSVTLPAGANEDDIKATYDKGILTVDVTVPEQAAAAAAEKHIAVQGS
jgi:HSP20 family molecular chaperone IbpA